MSVIFQNPDGVDGSPRHDAGVYTIEYALADKAESLGFDSLWGVEHHFNGYAVCPDPLNFLTYFAGRSTHLRLGTMVIVMPWRDPVRVAEDVSVLDHVSGGRNILGVGRGVAKIEFDGFRLDMNQSRQSLIEGTQALQMGLEKGYIEMDGEVVKQPYVQIRPLPVRSFRDRIYASASSPESFPIFARLGLGLLFIPGGRTWEETAQSLDEYRRIFRETQGRDAPAPIFVCWTYVHEDAAVARDKGREYIGKYVRSAHDHYKFTGEHLRGIKGYESYVEQADAARGAGFTIDDAANVFIENHIYGTPDECYERIAKARQDLGASAFIAVFNYGGMAPEDARRNQALFAAKVLPRLKALEPGLDIARPQPLASAAE